MLFSFYFWTPHVRLCSKHGGILFLKLPLYHYQLTMKLLICFTNLYLYFFLYWYTTAVFLVWEFLTIFVAGPELQLGTSVTGYIDGKFDDGYLVTVNLGCDQLKGVLYHIPQAFVSQGSNSSDVPPRRRRKRSRLSLHDPSQPKSYRSGYNFFFSEHYALLKPLHYGEEKLICKKIGMLWNNLTDAEKQVCYQTFVSLLFS